MSVREVKIGTSRYTQVLCLDEPGAGNACHQYAVLPTPPAGLADLFVDVHFADVHFQNGPVQEAGLNGCFQEDLIAIVIDRLRHFQAGPFACRENALALTKCEEALHWLNHRTADRQARGVEGTSEK